MVTTLRVVWIEIRTCISVAHADSVTTLRVVWIEIYSVPARLALKSASPPCGWCGLKSLTPALELSPSFVTTLRVVWIEINCSTGISSPIGSHHLAGGVD